MNIADDRSPRRDNRRASSLKRYISKPVMGLILLQNKDKNLFVPFFTHPFMSIHGEVQSVVVTASIRDMETFCIAYTLLE